MAVEGEGIENTADMLLWSWARFQWDDQNLGMPTRCVTDKANEGGIAVGAVRPPSDMPDAEALTDRAVAALGLRNKSLLRKAVFLRYERKYPDEGVAVALKMKLAEAKHLIGRAQRAVYRLRESLT